MRIGENKELVGTPPILPFFQKPTAVSQPSKFATLVGSHLLVSITPLGPINSMVFGVVGLGRRG